MFKVEAENFQSWRELEFDIESGVTLIDGVNEDDGGSSEGSGKSSVFTALSWGLYGKTPKDIGIDDVIREGAKSCHVRVTLPGGMVIFRSRKPNDLCFTHGEGSPQRGKDAKETQKQIVEDIGMTFEAFCHTTYHAQNSQTQFLNANQESKAKILSEMINLDIYDRARKVAHEREKEALAQLSQKEAEHALNLRDQEVIVGKIKLEEANHLHLKTQHETMAQNFIANIEALNGQIQRQSQIHALAAEEDAERLRGILELLHTEQSKIPSIMEEALKIECDIETTAPKVIDPERVSQGQSKLHKAEADLGVIKESMAIRKQEQELKTLFEAQISSKQEDILLLEKFVDNPNQDCPTCGTLLKDCDTTEAVKNITGLRTEVEGLKLKILTFVEKSKRDIPESEDLERIIKGTTAALKKACEVQGKFDSLETLKRHLDGKRCMVESSIGIHQKNLAKEKDLTPESLESLVRPLTLKLKGEDARLLKHLANPPELCFEVLDGLNIKLSETKAESEECAVREKSLKHDANILGELKSSFKTIKAYIFEALLSELNFKVAQYLEDLFEVQTALAFKNDGGKIKAEVEMDGVERKLGLLSGGQFRRMSFAVNLALNEIGRTRNGSQLNLLILDEFFKDLSEVGMERCLLLLQKLEVPVVMVEHNSIFKSIIDQTFFVTLEGGISRNGAESV